MNKGISDLFLPFLVPFSFCWFALSNFNVMGFFFLAYYILFSCILLLPLRNLFFSNKKQRVGLDRRECGAELEEYKM